MSSKNCICKLFENCAQAGLKKLYMYSSYGNAVGRYQACSRVLLMKGLSNVIIVIFWNVRMSAICINIYVLYVSMFRFFFFFSLLLV